MGTHTYQWEGEGRLKSVDGGTTVSYTYNALGQRVEKKVGSVYTEYVYGAYGELFNLHNRTTWTAHIVPMGATPLAVYQDGTTRFFHANGLGSTTFLTDHTGAVTQKTTYYPFGQSWVSAGTIKDNRFASLGQRDAETTTWQDPLDPTLFRLYTSGLGRWLSPDPLGGSVFNPQSLNRYAYVLNNPTNLIDPLGLSYCDLHPDAPACNRGFVDAVGSGMPVCGMSPRLPPMGGGGGGTSAGGGGSMPGNAQDPTLTYPGTVPPPTYPAIIAAIRACLSNPLCQVAAVIVGTVVVGYTAYTIYQASRVKVPTVDEVRLNCRLVAVVTEPADKYPGGISVEEVFNCNGVEFTIHCLYTKTGIQKECHVRPGGAKGGEGKP